jgi:hypothetical protein
VEDCRFGLSSTDLHRPVGTGSETAGRGPMVGRERMDIAVGKVTELIEYLRRFDG